MPLALVAVCSVALFGCNVVSPPSSGASPGPVLSTPQLLSNPSFETGTTANWIVSPGANVAIYDNGQAVEGSRYLETNTNNGKAGAGASIYQDVAISPVAGHGYRATVWLRAPDAPAPVTFALWALGGGKANRNGATTVTVSSTWTQVSAEVDVPVSGYSDLRFQVYLPTNNVNLDIDGAVLQDSGLANSSFENQFSGWSRTAGTNVAVDSGNAAEDAHYLETNVAARGDGVYQNVPAGSLAGHGYRATMLLRSPTGAKVNVAVVLTATGGTKQAATTTTTVASKAWSRHSVSIDVAAGGHSGLRVGLYLATPNVNVDIDAVQLEPTGITNSSFESQFSGWGRSSGENVAVYAKGANEDTHYLETNAPSPGGTVGHAIAKVPVAGHSYNASLALRVPSGKATVHLFLQALDGSATKAQGETILTPASTWHRYSVDLDVPAGTYTAMRLRLVLATAHVNVDLDAAEVLVPIPQPASTLLQKIVSVAVSQDQSHAAAHEQPVNSNCNKYTAYWGAGTTTYVAPSGQTLPCLDGTRNETWCSDFAAWVWQMAGAPVTYGTAPGDVNGWSYTWVGLGQSRGTWQSGATNDPQPGDAVLWGTYGNGGSVAPYGQHVGIVVGVSNGLIDVVSGNSGPLTALGNNVDVWESGYFNPATSTVDGYPILGYAAPTASASSARAKAVTPNVVTPGTTVPPVPVLTPKQLAARIAEQDGGR